VPPATVSSFVPQPSAFGSANSLFARSAFSESNCGTAGGVAGTDSSMPARVAPQNRKAPSS
jgi:hypothetical protein